MLGINNSLLKSVVTRGEQFIHLSQKLDLNKVDKTDTFDHSIFTFSSESAYSLNSTE